MPSRRARPEEQVQRAVVDYLRVALPDRLGVVWFAVPGHRGTRKRYEMGILNAMGVRAGVPDLAFIAQGRAFFIELKSAGGRLSKAQGEMIERLRGAGATTYFCRSIADVERVLRAEGLEPAGTVA